MTTARLWVLVVAVHVVALALLCASGPADVVMDAAEYWRLGNLTANGDLTWQAAPIAYRTPGYPAFLAAISSVSGDQAWRAVVVTQHLLLVLTAATTAWMVGQTTSSQRFALAAYAMTASGIVRTWFAQALLTETLFVFLLVIHFACLLRCLNGVTTIRCVAVGATLAAATLVRPVVQLWWLPVFGLITAVGAGGTSGQRLRRSVAGVLVAGLLLLPWVIRNQRAFGEPFLTQFAGRNFWVVTFQGGSGAGLPFPDTAAGNELLSRTGWEASDPRLRQTWTVSDRLRSEGMADDEVDRLMRRVGFDAIRRDSIRFGTSAASRLVNFWRCVPDPFPYVGDGSGASPPGQAGWGNAELSRYESLLYEKTLQRFLHWNELLAVGTLVSMILMICNSRTRWFGVALLLFFLMVSTLTALVEIPNVRYRMVLEPLMVVSLCCALSVLSEHASRRRKHPMDPAATPTAGRA